MPIPSNYPDAEEYLRRKFPLPSDRWDEYQAEQHDWAFVVARMTLAKLLDAAQRLIIAYERDGKDTDETIQQFRKEMARRGWTTGKKPGSKGEASHIRIIIETNARRAHSQERHRQMTQPHLLKQFPGRQWRHGDSPQFRPNHKRLHGKVFPSDDPFWDVVGAGMCAYGCKCNSFLVHKQFIDSGRFKIEQPPDPYTIAEPGFRKAPGTTPKSDRAQVFKDNMKNVSPRLRKRVEARLKREGIL